MTGAASQWRREIGEKIGSVYAENRKVAAVILGGSTARGHADRYSDIELGVFWRTPPSDEERQAETDRMGVDLVRLYPYDPSEEVWADDLKAGRSDPALERSGALVEVVHHTTDFIDRFSRPCWRTMTLT